MHTDFNVKPPHRRRARYRPTNKWNYVAWFLIILVAISLAVGVWHYGW